MTNNNNCYDKAMELMQQIQHQYLISNNRHDISTCWQAHKQTGVPGQAERINIAKHKVIDATKPLLLTTRTSLAKTAHRASVPNDSELYRVSNKVNFMEMLY